MSPEMKEVIYTMIASVCLAILLAFGTAMASTATVSVTVIVPCNNENYLTSPRCTAPVDVNSLTFEEEIYTGYLMSGVPFEEKVIIGNLRKHTMEEAYWYFDHTGMFFADNDTTAFLKYLWHVIKA